MPLSNRSMPYSSSLNATDPAGPTSDFPTTATPPGPSDRLVLERKVARANSSSAVHGSLMKSWQPDSKHSAAMLAGPLAISGMILVTGGADRKRDAGTTMASKRDWSMPSDRAG